MISVHSIDFAHNGHYVFSGVSLAIPQKGVATVVKPSNVNGAALLHLVNKRVTPSRNRVLFSNRGVPTVSHSHLCAIHGQVDVLFRSKTLFASVGMFSGITCPLHRRARLPTPLLRDAIVVGLRTIKLHKTTGLVPSRLSNKVTQHTTLTHTVTLRPSLVVFSRPFIKRSPVAVNMLIGLVSRLGDTLNIAYIIISRSIPRILDVTSRT